jgi:hypothetical protein
MVAAGPGRARGGGRIAWERARGWSDGEPGLGRARTIDVVSGSPGDRGPWREEAKRPRTIRNHPREAVPGWGPDELCSAGRGPQAPG